MITVKVGLFGMGTVGRGTYNALIMNSDAIEKAAGVHIEISRILVRSISAHMNDGIPLELFTQNPDDIINDPEIGIIAEVMGGIEPATSYMCAAISNGKHVVTANKAALAANGKRLQSLAMEHHVMLRFEASVGGGIPIINAVADPLVSNQYDEVLGILNGTTNYILTQMTESGRDYADVLKDAQNKGLAEADPSADVDGIDAANKLSILISLLFGKEMPPEKIPARGITSVSAADILYARENGYKIKLLAHAKKTQEGLICGVEATMLSLSHPLAAVGNEFNAIFVHGNVVDELMFYGKGAGSLPTGSAVLGDIIDIANCIAKGSAFDVKPLLNYDSVMPFIGEGQSQYYIRVTAADQPGVMSKLTAAFAEHNISLRSVTQKLDESESHVNVTITFVVYKTERNTLDKALATIIENRYAESIDSVLRIYER